MGNTKLYEVYSQSTGICTDTRTLSPGNLFFALKGPNFNANTLAEKAIAKGAIAAVIDDANYSTKNTILVEDCLEALQELARHHRQQLAYPIIGLTGSNGKTTTKELIYSVLSQKYKVACTQGNLNNHIGVALTVLSFKSDLDFAIVEMGANHQKEIEFLCGIAQPDYGLITNFGKAHLEGFGGVEGVIKGKSELYDYLRSKNKTAFINTDDPKQIKQIADYPKVIRFGQKEDNDFEIHLQSTAPFVKIRFKDIKIESHLIGAYNFSNIAVAVAIGAYFDMSPTEIKEGITGYKPDNNRSQILKIGSNNIILDAYNANPTSMLAALLNFKNTPGELKYLFLGDMFELGQESQAEHQTISDFAESNFKGHIYLIGEHFFKTNTSDKSIKCQSFEDAQNALEGISISNADIIIKGSRGMALERLLNLEIFK